MFRTLSCLACLIVMLGVAGAASAGIADDPSLVIYFSFDDFSDVVFDESGNGHDAIVHGDVSSATDVNHRAAEFGGVGGPAGFSYLDLDGANFPAEDIPTSGITLAAWAKCENTGGDHAIFNARASDSTWLVHPELRSDGNFRWLLRAAGGSTMFDIRAGTVTWGEWLHFAGTYDKASGKAILYINQEKVQEETVSNPRDIAGDWGSGARVGFNIDNARPFTGLMDDFYLFKRALSQDEVKEVAQIPPQLKAYGPDPADGAKHVMLPLLQWSPGDTAVFRDVYLGTSPELGPADLVSPRTVMMMYWHLLALEPGTTYYWRVDEIEADGTTHEGDVWRFTTVSLKASEPSPWDGEKWVDVAADLVWIPGTGAGSHDVYFGTDRAAVEAGDPDTSQGNQVQTTYDPGPLAEDTVYYWRVDEHAGDDVVHIGEVWSFTTLGAGAGVRAQYFRGTELAGLPLLTQTEDLIDHDWGAGEVAGGLSDGISARWTANLEAPFTENFQLITTHEDGVRLYLDGSLIIDNWNDYRATDDIAKVDLIAGQVYLLEMEWFETGGNAVAKLSWQSPSIRRQIIPSGWLQLPVRAASPSPPHAAVNVVQTSVLNWSAGEAAAHHDVYFGDDAEAVANADTTTAGVYRGQQEHTAYDPGPLEWNKTYYWRVDEVNATNADSPWQGRLWSFTTADFIIIEDFERFTTCDMPADVEFIWQVWVDGWENDNGSTVGHFECDEGFAEKEIVHSGWRSMPLDYNNINAPYYSEAERTWSVPRDWTVQGVDTLTLYVRGRIGNDASQPLYVGIGDSAGNIGVVAHPDPAILALPEWIEWKVPLSDFTGVNPAAGKKMVIGVGDRDAPSPGGTGTIFVDDIRVVKPEPAEE